MHDIRLVRDDPAAFDAALARRGIAAMSTELIALDERRRRATAQVQDALAERNALSKQIGQAMAAKDADRAAQLKSRVASLKDEVIEPGEAIAADAERALFDMMSGIPNLPAADVPVGADENDNQLCHERGHKPVFDFTAREHHAIGEALGFDFESGVRLAGTRFTVLRGAAARLSRALGQFMLDRLTCDGGYELVVPPLLVGDDVMFGTGQLPKFRDDQFRTDDGRWLIPTAEVSLTNLVREQILPEGDLPLRFTALTPCFRKEAGAAGRDTRGLIRQHQFDKVEMVSIVAPDDADAEHERMTACAEEMLDALELPYRRMKLCTGDMGFSAARTYDLEVWLPGQGTYREISSCSTCTDFQARRMNARYRPAGEKGTRFVRTLNGSGLAVGRTLVAVIENYQQADGGIAVPTALHPYLGGLNRLEPRG